MQAKASHGLVVTMARSMFGKMDLVLPMYEKWQDLVAQHVRLDSLKAEAHEVLDMTSFVRPPGKRGIELVAKMGKMLAADVSKMLCSHPEARVHSM